MAQVKVTTKPKLKLDVGLVFYKPAVRDTIARGNPAQMKAMLKTVTDMQKPGALEGMAAELKAAIARAK